MKLHRRSLFALFESPRAPESALCRTRLVEVRGENITQYCNRAIRGDRIISKRVGHASNVFNPQRTSLSRGVHIDHLSLIGQCTVVFFTHRHPVLRHLQTKRYLRLAGLAGWLAMMSASVACVVAQTELSFFIHIRIIKC